LVGGDVVDGVGVELRAAQSQARRDREPVRVHNGAGRADHDGGVSEDDRADRQSAEFPFPVHPHMLRHAGGYKLTKTKRRKPDGKMGRIDSFMGRVVPHANRQHREFFLVELKRPSLVVGRKELDQLEDYVNAILVQPDLSTLPPFGISIWLAASTTTSSRSG
jgi:hypothetical protein